MTTPSQALAFPSLDLDALEREIAKQVAKADGVEYKTRTQVMLEEQEEEAKRLESELAAIRGEARRLEDNIEKLQRLLARWRALESDATVQLAVTNSSVAALKQAGVTSSSPSTGTTRGQEG